MNQNKALWEKGDFTRIAACMRRSGEELVERLDLGADGQVLDLGCGDGTTAVPAARRSAGVLGVDIATNLVEAGNRRAKQQGLSNLRFVEGDACDLVDLKDGVFDTSVSIFGAMFAPKPEAVAKEMVRVTRPGGRIVMGNWIPGDPTLVAQILRISSAYAPPPAGAVSPMRWGVEEEVVERFGGAGVPENRISFDRDTFTFRSDDSPSAFLGLFRDYYGPTMNAYAAAEAAGSSDELHGELDELFNAQNRATDGSTVIDATFLRVTVEL